MFGVIERPIEDGEIAIYLPTDHDLPLQEIFRFYRDLEKHLRRQENFGSVFALRLSEYKAGSSEGRLWPKIRSEGRKGARVRQLESEEELLRKAERQTQAAERQADAAERAAKAAEDSALWSRKTFIATLAGAVATVIGVAVATGQVQLPQSDDPAAPPICEVVVSTTNNQQTLIVPAPQSLDSFSIESLAPSRPKGQAAPEFSAGTEEATLYIAADEGRTIRITGSLNADAATLVTDFDNTVPLISWPLNPKIGKGRYMFEVRVERDKGSDRLRGQVLRAERLDPF